MKTLQLLLACLLFPLIFHAQQKLTGLWVGAMSNDSTTVRNDQAFEIALTQYKEKVYGYSRSSFIVNDTLYYVLKRVKGTIEGDVCEMKDVEIVSYNFPGKLDKGVHVTITFRRNLQDSTWHLSGDWKTNKTRKYYSISGKVEVQSEPDLSKSKIFPHLEELSMDKDVEFYAASKKQAETARQQNNIVATKKKDEVQKTTDPVLTKTPATTNPVASNETHDAIAGKQEPIKKEEEPEETAVANTTIKKSELPASTIPAGDKKDVAASLPKPGVRNQEPLIKKEELVIPAPTEPADTKKSDLVTTVKPTEDRKFESGITPKVTVKAGAAAFVQERKTVAPQMLTFKSDSLQLALYDDGEIDGDTVSVLLNGEVFLAKQGLKASAIRKTIYIQPGSDEITLILYAENLGKYPPNTGLLVVHDGNDTYQVRFSADLQQNASIVFRRKK